jgi:integrase
MASIRKRPNGKWMAEIRMAKQPARRKTFSTKRLAKEWAAKTEATMQKGGQVSTEKLSWLIDLYIEEKITEPAAINYLKWWRDRLGDTRIVDLHRRDFAEAQSALKKKKKVRVDGLLSAGTINRRMAFISAALSWGIEQGYFDTNPARGVRMVSEDNTRDRLLTDDERKRLLDACRTHHEPCLLLLVRLAMITGCRAGELQGLTWSAVDLEKGEARITHTYGKKTTKTGKSRVVPITREALALLKEHKKTRRHIAHDFIFYNTFRGTVPYNYQNHWTDVKATAGIDDLRFHDLRHSCASELAMAGVSMGQIANLLGHSNINQTQRYSHYSSQSVKELGEILADRIG